MASAQPHKHLRVGIIQGDRILEEHHVARDPVSIGTDGKNTIVLPESDVTSAKFTLFENRNGQYQLVFDEWMKGRVHLGSSDVDFATLRKQGTAQSRGDLYVLPLEESARGKVELGDVTLFFQFVTPPPANARPELPADVKGAFWRTMDRVFFGALAASLFLHFSGAAYIMTQETPKEPELALDELQDRFVRANIIPPKPPEPERKPEAPQADAAGKAEDKPKDSGEPKPETKPSGEAVAQRKAEVAKKVAGKGLLKILGAAGSGSGGAFADVLGGSTGGGDIAEALAGAGGVGVATEASVGATGPRGGGTGNVSSIGEVGTSGGGKVDLGTKKEVKVEGRISTSTPEVDSADVDRDAVARYVKGRIKSLQSCYEKELKRNPSLKGKLVVRFSIMPSGRTGDVEIDEDTLGNDAVGACIRSYIRGWVFPFKPDGEVPVSYPLVFSPAG